MITGDTKKELSGVEKALKDIHTELRIMNEHLERVSLDGLTVYVEMAKYQPTCCANLDQLEE